MNKGIKSAEIFGEIQAIPSKSYAHRISICNFLAGNPPKADCNGFSSADILVTENCLKTLANGGKELDCGESGSTLRFLIPLCAVMGGDYSFIGHGKLMERPNAELFSVLNEHGVKTSQTDSIKISGKLTGGEFHIRGDISSQYISGLLMALPYLNADSKIVLTTPLVSAPYVDITLEVLSSFGVMIEKTEYGFSINGGQKYSGNIVPEGDWSNAAFFLALGGITGKVAVKGLNINSVQGDRFITEILRLAGAKVTFKENSVTASANKLEGFSFDAENCPDLVPVSAAIAAFADGKTVIKNIQRLKIKESDRIATTIATLSAFGIRAESDGKDLVVYGGKPVGCKVNSFNDHRIAMSAAVLGAGAVGDTFITDAQAVNKSYPTFFEDFCKVGGITYDI